MHWSVNGHRRFVRLRCCGTCVRRYCCLQNVPRALGARQVLFEDLSRLRSYFVWEADFELYNQVSPLGGDLWEGQPFPSQSFHGARLDDVVAGQRDHPPVESGNVHCTATQGLQGRRANSETGCNLESLEKARVCKSSQGSEPAPGLSSSAPSPSRHDTSPWPVAVTHFTSISNAAATPLSSGGYTGVSPVCTS